MACYISIAPINRIEALKPQFTKYWQIIGKGKIQMSGLDKLRLMREKLNAQQQMGGGGDKAAYPFWNMANDASVSVRFLPDKNNDNPFMWAEKQTFKWKFADSRRPQSSLTITLPCREMYDGPKSCPIVNEIRPMWKGGDEEIAKVLWPKKSYIYQGFIRRSSIVEESKPENPIRILLINKEIHTFIRGSLLSEDPEVRLDISPDDFENGRDFVIRKTKKGEWSNYGTSQWANNPSSLTDEEITAIEKHGLWDLNSRLPKRPSNEAFDVMYEMFQVAMRGGAWDPKWEVHFKPNQERGNGGSRAEVDEHDDSPEVPASKPIPAPSAANDALAKLRGAKPPVATPAVVAEKPVFENTPAPVQPAKPGENASSVLARLNALKQNKAS